MPKLGVSTSYCAKNRNSKHERRQACCLHGNQGLPCKAKEKSRVALNLMSRSFKAVVFLFFITKNSKSSLSSFLSKKLLIKHKET